jgi:hypothetical protein
VNYFDKYSTIFFSADPHVELLKLAAHERSWILQAIKRFGDYYHRKYNNREVESALNTKNTNLTISTPHNSNMVENIVSWVS